MTKSACLEEQVRGVYGNVLYLILVRNYSYVDKDK